MTQCRLFAMRERQQVGRSQCPSCVFTSYHDDIMYRQPGRLSVIKGHRARLDFNITLDVYNIPSLIILYHDE